MGQPQHAFSAKELELLEQMQRTQKMLAALASLIDTARDLHAIPSEGLAALIDLIADRLEQPAH